METHELSLGVWVHHPTILTFLLVLLLLIMKLAHTNLCELLKVIQLDSNFETLMYIMSIHQCYINTCGKKKKILQRLQNRTTRIITRTSKLNSFLSEQATKVNNPIHYVMKNKYGLITSPKHRKNDSKISISRGETHDDVVAS